MSPPPVRLAVLVFLLALSAAHPTQQPSPADDSLANLLGPALEATLARALARWQPPALADLSRLHERLDVLERQLAGLQVPTPYLPTPYLPWMASVRGGRRLPPPAEEPLCEPHPSPLPAGQTPHPKPAVLACAKSCKQLRDDGGSPEDGVYWFTGMPVPTLCDFSHDDGGWTLLLTAATRPGWDPLSVQERNERAPSLSDNYSIVKHADAIRDLNSSGGTRFAYRIEAQAESGRRRWGGIWQAPRHYSFVAQSNGQTEVTLVRKFDNWSYNDNGIEQRMPWLNNGAGDGLLTTSTSPGGAWWGTLVTRETQTTYHHSPWIHQDATQSGKVLYWVRE